MFYSRSDWDGDLRLVETMCDFLLVKQSFQVRMADRYGIEVGICDVNLVLKRKQRDVGVVCFVLSFNRLKLV